MFLCAAMSRVHLILILNIVYVFLGGGGRGGGGVSQLFESLHFLLFAFFSVEKLLFLFYPHSVRSCLLKTSV